MLLCQLIHHQLVVRLPWKQAVRLRRTPRRWIVVHWAGVYHQLAISFMAAGVGNGVGGMLRLACQLTGLFMLETTVSVGIGVGTIIAHPQNVSLNHRKGDIYTGRQMTS